MAVMPLGVLAASCALGTFDKIEPPPPKGLECRHTSVPLPPDLADASNGDASSNGDVEFTTALRRIRLKYSADGGPLGLDLDRYCSCQGEPPSCIAPEGQDPALSCDRAEGRDNQVSDVFRIIEAVLLFPPEGDQLSDLYSEFANLGRWTIVVRVVGYNGLPNDDNVRVEWYPSGGTPSPQWDGNDTWPVVPSCVTDAGVPLYVDNDAYVTNGNLVFAMTESPFTATNGTNRLSVLVSDGTGSARIVVDKNGYHLADGVLAGRVKLDNLFRMVADFRNHNGAAFCADNNNLYWQPTREIFCRGLDIQVGSPQPNKKCDAMSIAVGFDSEPAHLGNAEVVDGGGVQMDCPLGLDPYSAFLDAGCPPPPDRPKDAAAD